MKSPRSERESRWHLCLEGAGAAILVALPLMILHILPSRQTLFHELLPMNPVYQGVLIDFLVVVAASIFAFWLLDRWTPYHRGLAWLLVAALLVMRLFRGLSVGELISPGTAAGGRIFLLIVAPGLLLWFLRRSWYDPAVRAGRLVLLLLGFSAVWLLPELTVMAFRPEPHERAGFSKPIAEAPQRRIVWILFDEASYDQLFDHRQPGIDYPNVDHFAASAVTFSNVQPAGYFTEKVIPSLFTGDVITDERSDLDGRLFVRTVAHPHWHLYEASHTVFADAQYAGWPTAAIGWYNPYCRTDASALDDCYWTLTTPLPGRYSPGRSALQNAVAPVSKSLLRLIGRRVQDPTPWQMHAADYTVLMQHALAEIRTDRSGFVFIHLPLPHPGGFYNRRTRQIGVDGSYLDNLVLTDHTLGRLMEAVNATPVAGQTAVIVCSDHSWRVNLWRPTSDWRPEDAHVSGGRFDPRPLLMVHFAAETEAMRVAQPFPLLALHAMLERMIGGQLTGAQQLAAWAAQQ